MSLKVKFIAIFGILATIVLGNWVVMIWAKENASNKQSWVEHTHEVIVNSSRFLGSLRDTETGQRGFLLTNQDEYLAPYHAGLDGAARYFAKLKDLTSDNPTQQTRLESIQPIMSAKFAELKQTIELAKQGKITESLAIVRSGEGKQLMADLRQQVNQFSLEEERLLKERINALEIEEKNLDILFGLESFFLIVSIFVAAYYIQRSLLNPIINLTNGAEKVAKNEFGLIVPLSGYDEIRRLTKTFNEMAQSVESRNEALKEQTRFTEAYSQIVTTCNSNHDLNTTLYEALAIHTSNHPSPFGAVYLHDEETGELQLTVSYGASVEIMAGATIGSGPILQAFNSNQSLVVDAKAVDGLSIGAGLKESNHPSMVFNPINHGQKTLGMVVLAYTRVPADQDLQYIANLAMQFGITIINRQQFTALQELTTELTESRQQVIAERDQAVIDSYTDALTGLYNRGYLECRIGQMINQSSRYDHHLSVVLIDIDLFKRINDSRGHQTGDEVLKFIGALLKEEIRRSDLLARYGGEEFILVLPQTSLHEARDAAEKLRRIVEKQNIPALCGESLTISLGVATLNEADKNMEKSLIGRADKALYRAKNKGRNQVCVADL